MKVTHYQQMMAYLTRPGYDKGGKVLPKKKPQEEIKKRSRINYEKLKKYLDPESQMFIEKELGFAIGGSVETPKRGLVDEPGSYSVKDTYAGRPTKLYSSLKNAVTPERYEQIKFANPEMSEKQLEKNYKKLTRSQKYDLISLQKGGVYKNKSGMINPTRSKIVKLRNRVVTLRNFKIVEEAGIINPETKKPFTQEEFLQTTDSKRNYYLRLASDPIGFRKEQREEYKRRVDEGRVKVKGYDTTPTALRNERNGLLRFLQRAADEGNPNYKVVKRKGKIIGVKDKKAGVVYRPAIFTKPYSEKNHVSIHEHPDYRKVHNPYYKTQGGRPGLFELAKEFKFTSPNTTLGTYFAKYGQVPSYSDMYNFLTRGPESAAFRKQFNALEKHHVSLVRGSPTKNIQLTLHDKNSQAEFLLRSYDDPNSPYYKDQKYMDRELKKINARLKVGNKILGGAPLTGEKALAAAKRETVRLFKKRLTENPNIADDLVKAVNALPKNKKIKICNSLKSGGLPGDCPKAIEKDPIKTSNTILKETKNLKTEAGVRAAGLARNLIRLGIVGEAGFLAGEAAIGNIFSGRPFTESLQSTFFMPGKADAARERRAGLTTREQMISDAIGLQGKIASLESQIEEAEKLGDDASIPVLQKALRETKAELESPVDPTDRLGGTTLEDLTSPYSATNISRQRKLDNILDADKAKSIASQMTLRDVERGIPNIADYGEIDSGVSRKVFEPRKTLPADDDFFAEYLRKQLFQDAFSEKEFSVDPMDPTDKLKSDTIYDFLKEDITPMDEFLMKGSDPRFAEQTRGTQGGDKAIGNIPYRRKSSYIPSPLQLQEQDKLIEEGARLGAAGGGIAKLAGVDSGPAPKSGPTPDGPSKGLAYLFKNGMEEQE